MCREFGCLPSQLYEEDAELVRLLVIEQKGKRRKEGDGGE